MVVFIFFWQGSYPPWWHHTGILKWLESLCKGFHPAGHQIHVYPKAFCLFVCVFVFVCLFGCPVEWSLGPDLTSRRVFEASTKSNWNLCGSWSYAYYRNLVLNMVAFFQTGFLKPGGNPETFQPPRLSDVMSLHLRESAKDTWHISKPGAFAASDTGKLIVWQHFLVYLVCTTLGEILVKVPNPDPFGGMHWKMLGLSLTCFWYSSWWLGWRNADWATSKTWTTSNSGSFS